MNYKVAVVLGAGPKLIHAQNRARTGAALYKSGLVSKIITTGKNEANELAEIVFNDGVPNNDIIKEPNSKTTYENLKNLRRIFDLSVKQTGLPEITYLISQDWHRQRLLYISAHILGEKYSHKFYEAPDGRSQVDIDHDAKLETLKFWVDKITLSVPVFGGIMNSLAYWLYYRFYKNVRRK